MPRDPPPVAPAPSAAELPEPSPSSAAEAWCLGASQGVQRAGPWDLWEFGLAARGVGRLVADMSWREVVADAQQPETRNFLPATCDCFSRAVRRKRFPECMSRLVHAMACAWPVRPCVVVVRNSTPLGDTWSLRLGGSAVVMAGGQLGIALALLGPASSPLPACCPARIVRQWRDLSPTAVALADRSPCIVTFGWHWARESLT